MTNTQPNFLLLTVDTWRADRLGLYGYTRPTSPNLDRFAENAIVCDNAFTLGPFTQVACIQLFTSSRPLSYGGYDLGAGGGRPRNLFRHFQQAGYHTAGLSTIHWVSPYYGYTDGLDEDASLILLNTIAGMAYNNMRDTVIGYHAGTVEADVMLAVVEPVMHRLFDNVTHYCDRMIAERPWMVRAYPFAKAIRDGYDFAKVKRVIEDHRRRFDAGPQAYVDSQLKEIPDPHEWIAAEWRMARTPSALAAKAIDRLLEKIVGPLMPGMVGRRANRYRMSVDAHAIADKVTAQLANRPSGKPFFIWAHFKDTHMPYVSGPGKNWFDRTPGYLKALGYDAAIDPVAPFDPATTKRADAREVLSPLYDAAVRSTDEAMGRIFTALEATGESGNTCVGICGDHGEEIGEHGDFGHRVMPYEHNSRIPMMFRAPDRIGARVNDLVTTMDFAPTLSALAGLNPAPGWEGAPVSSSDVAARDAVVMEAFCRGNCMFESRAPYMAVRTPTHKFIWYEFVDPHHKAGVPGPMLFDLEIDPLEQNNIFKPDHPLVSAFEKRLADRLAEIPEYPRSRIAANFGHIWKEAS
jgi:arylsulfatase A-like enzyme